MPVKVGDRMLFVRIDDIVYFSAEEKYVNIHTTDGKTYLSDLTLKILEDKLGDKFLRVHRAAVVNISRIREIDKHFSSRFILKIDDSGQTKLMTGRNYCEQVKMLMEI